jgi:hypothetical protein
MFPETPWCARCSGCASSSFVSAAATSYSGVAPAAAWCPCTANSSWARLAGVLKQAGLTAQEFIDALHA